MFPEIDAHNDFIQFNSSTKNTNANTTFIWDLKNNKPV